MPLARFPLCYSPIHRLALTDGDWALGIHSRCSASDSVSCAVDFLSSKPAHSNLVISLRLLRDWQIRDAFLGVLNFMIMPSLLSMQIVSLLICNKGAKGLRSLYKSKDAAVDSVTGHGG
jgi:hypothetical protein